MSEAQQGPQLKGPKLKGPSDAMSGLSQVMQIAMTPVNLAKAVMNPLSAPKVVMESLPGGAGELGPVKEAAGMLSKLGSMLKNPIKGVAETGLSTAQGEDPMGAVTGGAGKLAGAAAQGGKLAGKAMEAAGAASEAAGTGLNAAGQGMMGFGKSIQAIPIAGQIIGIPIVAAGVGTKTLGVAAKVSGKAMKVAGKAIKVASSLVDKISKAVGKVVKPVLKIGRRIAKPLKAVARRTVSLAKGAGQVGGSLSRLTQLQDHAAKGDLKGLAQTSHAAAKGVRGGVQQGAGRSGAAGARPGLVQRAFALAKGPQAQGRGSAAAGGPVKSSAPKGGLLGGLQSARTAGRKAQPLVGRAKQILALPRAAVQRLQSGMTAATSLVKLQDHAAKGDLGNLARSAADTGKAASQAGAVRVPKLPGGAPSPREAFRTPTPRQSAALAYYRSNRLSR